MVATPLSPARFLSRTLALGAAVVLAGTVLAAAPPAEAAVTKPLDIVKVHFDPKGTDKPTNSGYTQEYIQLKNTGSRTLNLSGYVIRDNGPQKYVFPKGVTLKPGKTLTVRSGKGSSSSTTRYWGKSSYIWNNTGDTARIYDAKGKRLETCTIKRGSGKTTQTC